MNPITLRIPSDLLAKVEEQFSAKTRTESLLKAIAKGLDFEKYKEKEMVQDYQSLSDEECDFVVDAQELVFKDSDEEDFSDYLKVAQCKWSSI